MDLNIPADDPDRFRGNGARGEDGNEWIAVVGKGRGATEITGLCGWIPYRLWVYSIVQKVG